MRQAAGIMLIIFSMFLLNTAISALSGYDIHVYDLVFNLVLIIPVAFLITGGIFCFVKKYWKVCLASAWLAVFFMILWLTGSHPYGLDWLSWVFPILGTLSIIFVYLTKQEWKEIQG
jgi:hypothetical protein